MVGLSNNLKYKLEKLFGMGTGYVLNFSNTSFSDFVETSVGFDPYIRYSGSKAQVLRQLWSNEPVEVTRRLLLELLERWHTDALLSEAGISPTDQQLYNSLKLEVEALVGDVRVSDGDQAFLDKDFAALDPTKLQVAVDFKRVIGDRLVEVDRCSEAEAPLAVVFLCGSTIEGLLLEVATSRPLNYNQCRSAPRTRDGKVKPLSQWTLADLIVTSRELGIIGEDVVKHAEAVRDFRNYIHPREQLKANFLPRMFTAQMAHQVLRAVIADLQRA